MRQIFPRNVNLHTIGGQLSNWFSSSRGGQSIFYPENVAIVILVMLVMLNLKGARKEEDHGLEWLPTVFCGRCIRSFVGYSRLCSHVWDLGWEKPFYSSNQGINGQENMPLNVKSINGPR